MLNKKQGVCHTDATYKITTSGHFLNVLGVTDIRGHFHPACFMLTSHETQTDLKYFYEGIQNFDLDFACSPKYMMIDANKANLNAIHECFSSAMVLMCYFNVKLFSCIVDYSNRADTMNTFSLNHVVVAAQPLLNGLFAST